jgi:hypothetical protein
MDFQKIADTVKAQKGAVALQRLSLKLGKDINKLIADKVADAALAAKAVVIARELGVTL